MTQIDWPQTASIFTVLSMLAAMAFLVLRAQLARWFTTRSEHAELNDRLDAIEQKVGTMPAHQDITALADRVGGVERGIAVAQATLDGVKAGVGRVEHFVDMLVQQQISEERK